jgi:peptidoglycan-associated lipoprotein
MAPVAPAPVVQAAPPPVAAVIQKADDNPARGNIVISYDVRKACGIDDVDAYFSFDSDHVRTGDKKVLRTLADCFTSGPLKGRQMSLVGHADPRGSEDYNMALGGRRADNVKLIIVAESMDAGNVSTSSRGKMDATGTDEASWAKDRSVDVALAN